MSSSMKKILVVLGATGNQGGSVARAFLSDTALASHWHVRAITRNPSSESAAKLSKLGAEMVSASLDSISELKSAFADATAIFAVTDFWSAIRTQEVADRVRSEGVGLAIAAQDLEEAWGRNLAAAAAAIPTLERFIFSSLPPVSKLSRERLKHVHHFDGKANIVRNIQQEYPALWNKTSQILVGFYNSNILPGSYFGPRFNSESGKIEFEGPVSDDTPIPFIDAPSSTGIFVKTLVLTEPAGTILAAYDEMKSLRECIEVLREKTSRDFVFLQRTVDEMAAESLLGREAPESWVWLAEYGLFGEKVNGWKESLTAPTGLKANVTAVNLNEWLSEQDWSKAFQSV
ncbi:NmrA-like family protein [Colletotrichum orchidophilum]|uniref:NmrA-like family protein n=1 Tax=Colletotrichum orchidophilum TaxID=1209926 RepID=A0A1G4BA39_9PEZI|nr:NmrA-like family protein [Colletotrichum orchidophilum]OHE98281.1 NmrA-like family protein [Colletotrichum orchidophilum]